MRLVLFWSRGGAVDAAYTCMQEEQQEQERQQEQQQAGAAGAAGAGGSCEMMM